MDKFPLTHAFVALICVEMKGGSYDYWYKTLCSYQISSYCHCQQCYTFNTICDEGIGAFDCGDIILFFTKTIVLMHANADGTLNEFEVPTRDDIIPYAKEYEYFFDPTYRSDITTAEAKAICEEWIRAG